MGWDGMGPHHSTGHGESRRRHVDGGGDRENIIAFGGGIYSIYL
jgi:hypothetical protein